MFEIFMQKSLETSKYSRLHLAPTINFCVPFAHAVRAVFADMGVRFNAKDFIYVTVLVAKIYSRETATSFIMSEKVKKTGSGVVAISSPSCSFQGPRYQSKPFINLLRVHGRLRSIVRHGPRPQRRGSPY